MRFISTLVNLFSSNVRYCHFLHFQSRKFLKKRREFFKTVGITEGDIADVTSKRRLTEKLNEKKERVSSFKC